MVFRHTHHSAGANCSIRRAFLAGLALPLAVPAQTEGFHEAWIASGVTALRGAMTRSTSPPIPGSG
jgi:hypothetical protein